MTIISSEVDSPSTWERPRKIVSAGTKRTPPPTPTRPPARPPRIAIRTARTSFMLGPPRSRNDQLDCYRHQERREQERDRALRDPLLDRGAEDDAEDRGSGQRQTGG